jgi:hypothetical protein
MVSPFSEKLVSKDSPSFSYNCFRIAATCAVLAPTFGIAAMATENGNVGRLALVCLIGAGCSFVAGVIAGIWGE